MFSWEGIYGQDNVINILNKVIVSGNIPHAFLFTGNQGTGKYLCALRFSQYLNHDLNYPDLFNSISNLAEPFIKYIFPLPRGKNETESSSPFDKLSSDEIQLVQEQIELKKSNPYWQISIPKANQIKVNSIRDIKKFLSYNYDDIKFRTIIISDAHLLNEEAQNALLKNLEEPPPGIIFILTTPFPMLLRETIRSRCWHISFQPLKNSDVRDILVNYFSIESDKAETASRFSNGSVTFALKMLENNLEDLLDKTISLMRFSFGKKINSAYTELGDLLEDNDPELFKLLIQLIITWLNDVLKYRAGIKDDISFVKYAETIKKFNSKFPHADILRVSSRLEYFSSLLKNNVHPGLISINLINTLASLTAK